MEYTQQQHRNRHDLQHPIPQRRYAFIFPHEHTEPEQVTSSTSNNSSASPPAPQTWAPMDGLSRPVSAPVVLQPDDIAGLERASSPLSRVTNPMVRDYHFRRGVAANPVNSASADNLHSHHRLHVHSSTRVVPSINASAPGDVTN